jgi:hypothetical protein
MEKVRAQFLSLRHHISATRTVSPETCENSADFTEDFAQENLMRQSQMLSIGLENAFFSKGLRHSRSNNNSADCRKLVLVQVSFGLFYFGGYRRCLVYRDAASLP